MTGHFSGPGKIFEKTSHLLLHFPADYARIIEPAIRGHEYAAVAQLDRVFGYEPKGRGFESLQPYHVVADFVSFATAFSFSKQTSSLIHSVAPPFKIETASLGFDFVGRPAGGIFLH